MDTMVFNCPYCQASIEVEKTAAGQQAACPSCGKTIIIPETSEGNTVPEAPEENAATPKRPVVPPVLAPAILPAKSDGAIPHKPKQFQYKVLTQKDQWFTQKFDPESLEKALNAYAHHGWHVVTSATASFPGFLGGNREELVILMERELAFRSMLNDIAFIEGNVPGAQIIKPVSTSIDGLFKQAQLKNLDNVKVAMAQMAKQAGGNAIVDFTYGQRTVGVLQSLVSLDDVIWHAEGNIAVVSREDL